LVAVEVGKELLLLEVAGQAADLELMVFLQIFMGLAPQGKVIEVVLDMMVQFNLHVLAVVAGLVPLEEIQEHHPQTLLVVMAE
jgi:hypothetical protein